MKGLVESLLSSSENISEAKVTINSKDVYKKLVNFYGKELIDSNIKEIKSHGYDMKPYYRQDQEHWDALGNDRVLIRLLYSLMNNSNYKDDVITQLMKDVYKNNNLSSTDVIFKI